MPYVKKGAIDSIKKCPHCGGTSGYRTTLYVSGWITDNHTFDGEPDNTEQLDSLKYSRETKYYICRDCGERICKREPITL